MPVDGPGRTLVRLAAAAAALLAAAALAQPRAETLAACAVCHGPGGNATIPQFPSLAGQPRVFLENQLVLIREGLRDTPAMKDVMAGMTDEQIGALASHYAAQPVAARPEPAHPDRARLGAETARRMLCGTCHLPDYSGQAQVPRLAGQNEQYLRLSMRQFRDQPGPGRDTIMAASLYGLSDADLDNLAHYLASFRP
jgi:cytochrome c553